MKLFVKNLIVGAVKEAGYKLPDNFSVEVPPKTEYGDYATNVALVIPAKNKESREVALEIAIKLRNQDSIEKVDVAGPGFINIFIKEDFYHQKFKEILEKKEDYGRGKPKKKSIQVEYISANPTGPLHIGNARGGPIGEALANLYSFLGYKVEREFFVNDVGGQVDRFAESLFYWFEKKTDPKVTFPEDGYQGSYVKKLSEIIQKEKKEELARFKDKREIIEIFKKEGIYHMVRAIREDAKLLGIEFDRWVNQSDFSFSEKTEKLIEKLGKKGMTVKKEGALWFKSPDDPELQNKESVLKKSDETGSLTYFADDIAYHADKFERGFLKIIDIWGANHYGHIPRLKAAIRALGYNDKKLEIILYQYVRLKNDGKVKSMGKRKGDFVTLRQVLESGVEPDAFKFFILNQNPNTPFDFNLKLVADTSEKNPVYYIKYAHARICSILAKNKKSRVGLGEADLSLLCNPKEIVLHKELIRFPEILEEISTNFQIQTLPHFAYKIATCFHEFYNECQVLCKDKKLSASRLSLVTAAKYVLASVLKICDIEAPEKM